MSERYTEKELAIVDINDAGIASRLSPTGDTQQLVGDHTHRRLKARHIQLIGIGGSIGTSLFLQIGFVLSKGGPGSLLIAFMWWSTVVLSVNNCLAEMVTWIPISSPFVRFSDRFVDPAFGLVSGVNFFVYLAFLVPFEITAFNLVIHFWTDKIPVSAVVSFVIVCYILLNAFTVKFYGETEFWLALGKVVLAIGLILFTFITMIGGNPQHDVFGFRSWDPSKTPGTPFIEYIKTGSTGRLMGFLAALIQASFTICGPEFLSMTAGEAQHPRKMMPRTFKSVGFRLVAFFILGAFCVGILLPYNDPALAKAFEDPQPGAGSSPYVIAMQNLHIRGLSHLVNFLILLSVFSAGNSYVYCASRTLYGLALEKKLPKFMGHCSKAGIPIYCVATTISISLLAFLQVSNNASVVLDWLVTLVTVCGLLNYAFICVTYIKFYNGLKAQGISRYTLPYQGLLQPYCAYYSLFFTSVMAWLVGYAVFLPGGWNITLFVFSYLIIFILPFIYLFWKLLKKAKWVKNREMYFFDVDRQMIDQYEDSISQEIPSSRMGKVWIWLLG